MMRLPILVVVSFLFFNACSNKLTIDIEEEITQTEIPDTIRIGQWNVFMFGIRDNVWGIPKETYLEDFNHVKSVLSLLKADVVFLNEFNEYLDQGKSVSAYNALFTEYPYFVKGGSYCAIASKFPISIKVVSFASRSFLLGTMRLGDIIVGVACIHPIPDFSSNSIIERIQDHYKVIDYLKSYQCSIIAGDFNTKEDFELDVYKENGYVFCNRGDFGTFVTFPSDHRSLDNIMIKGLTVLSCTVINDAAVSDHYPSLATVDASSRH